MVTISSDKGEMKSEGDEQLGALSRVVEFIAPSLGEQDKEAANRHSRSRK